MTPGLQLRTAPTADLDPAEVTALRALLDAAFDHDFSDTDWSHALGGLHVLATRDGELVGHAAVVGRQLGVGGRPLRTGYVEAVAVAAEARRQGVAGAVMTEVERLVAGGCELGALAASEAGSALYAGRGWTSWQGRLLHLTPDGVADGDDSLVYVRSTPSTPGRLDTSLPLVADWRRGDPW